MSPESSTAWTWLRFLAGGAANTLITYAAYLALVHVLDYQIAFAIVFAAGVGFAFFVNGLYVFRGPLSLLVFVGFVAIYGLQYLLGRLIIGGVVEHGWLSKELALLPALMVTVPLSFVLMSGLFRLKAT